MNQNTKYSKEQHIYLTALAWKQQAYADWQAAGDDDRVNAALCEAITACQLAEQNLIDWAFHRLETDPLSAEQYKDVYPQIEKLRHTQNKNVKPRLLDWCLRLDPAEDGKTIAEWVQQIPSDWNRDE